MSCQMSNREEGKSIMIVWHRSLFEVNFTSVKYWIFSMLNTQSLNCNGIPSLPFSSSSEGEREKERRTEKVNGALFSFFEKESVGTRLSKQTAWSCDLTSNKQQHSKSWIIFSFVLVTTLWVLRRKSAHAQRPTFSRRRRRHRRLLPFSARTMSI